MKASGRLATTKSPTDASIFGLTFHFNPFHRVCFWFDGGSGRSTNNTRVQAGTMQTHPRTIPCRDPLGGLPLSLEPPCSEEHHPEPSSIGGPVQPIATRSPSVEVVSMNRPKRVTVVRRDLTHSHPSDLDVATPTKHTPTYAPVRSAFDRARVAKSASYISAMFIQRRWTREHFSHARSEAPLAAAPPTGALR